MALHQTDYFQGLFRVLGQESRLIREALYYLYKFKTTTKSNANIVEADREENTFKEMFISQSKVMFLNFIPVLLFCQHCSEIKSFYTSELRH